MDKEADYQICPVCKDEFTLVAQRCTECDVDLVAPGAAAPDDLPPASELVCIRVAPVSWIEALSGVLEQGGVMHRVEPATASDAPDGQDTSAFGTSELIGIYVEQEHADRARSVDGEIASQVLPDEPEMLSEPNAESCPACGESLANDATECPECGLAFGG